MLAKRHHTGRRNAAVLLALAFACGCTCSEKKPPSDDPLRLKKRIEVDSVYLWAAAKEAVGAKDGDPALIAARDKALALAAKGGAQETNSLLADFSLTELMVLGKAVLSAKETGKAVVSGARPEGDPVIPRLLPLFGAPAGYADLVDANMDHALFFIASGAVRLRDDPKMPIPEEVVLYEASRTNADTLKVPGTAALVHAFRAYYYGTNDFCDMAEEDAAAADTATRQADLVLKGIGLFTEGQTSATVQDLQLLLPALRILAHAGPAVCRYKRGDTASARPWLKKVVDEIKQTSLAGPRDVTVLEAFYACGGTADEITKGTALLATLPEVADPTADQDRRAAVAYCQAPVQTKPDLLKQYPLAERTVAIAGIAAKNSNIVNALESSRAYRAAVSAAAIADSAIAATKSVTGAVDMLKGLFQQPSPNN